jgi:protein O-GlcNAc transferase
VPSRARNNGDQSKFRTAISLHQQGHVAQAADLYEELIRKRPPNLLALHYLGIIEASRGNVSRAKSLISRSLAIEPANVQFIENYATILFQTADYKSALQIAEKGLQLRQANIALLYISAIALYKMGRLQEALYRFDSLLSLEPNHIAAINERGSVLAAMKNYDAALSCFDKVLEFEPKYAEAHLNKGNVLGALKRYDEAVAVYNKALAIRPDLAAAWAGRGNVLAELKKYDDAMVAFDKAIILQPDLIETWLGRGNLLIALAQYDDALAAYDKALNLKPDSAPAWHGRGNALAELKRRDEALAAYERAVKLKPDMTYAAGARLLFKLMLCEWANLKTETAQFLTLVRDGVHVSSPFVLLATPASAAEQLRYVKSYVQEQPKLPQLWGGEVYSHDRIRIAYLSADLHEHPVAYLMAGLFERHHRSHFEVTALSLRAQQDSQFHRRIKASFERFIDVHSDSDQKIADLIRRLEIDIVVDLNGFTPNGRPDILMLRPSPIQVNYLGYAATMGADYYDYIIADPIVIPEQQFECYGEKVVWLPDTFIPNDDTRRIAERTPARSELNLPEPGFVFCCFNQSHKIEPLIFDVWMRLLKQVDGSVLWLVDNGPTPRLNLRREAAGRGVAPERLIFAPRVPFAADHLARHRQADLFLDTLYYNAHTTACDALWAGLPVVTCLGATFAGRVGASLLNALGVPELIAASLDDYEALALKLARDPSLLASVKAKLARNRDSYPLFDTKRFARHIEAAYTTMWERYQRGNATKPFAVGRTAPSGQ